MDQQQCGRTVCNSSRSSNIINVGGGGGGVVIPHSSPSPSPSPSSHSSMEMVNDSPLQPQPQPHHNMAAAARVFGNSNNSDPSPYYFMDGGGGGGPNNNSNLIGTSSSISVASTPSNTTANTSRSVMWSMRAKIMSHPHFPRLLAAYSNCQKVGAPAEVAARLEEVCGAAVMAARSASSSSGGVGSSRNNNNSRIGEDPALDQFMEAYCEMLTKYEQELSKPFKEAMLFLSKVDSQLRALTLPDSSPTSAGRNNNGSSEDDMDGLDASFIDPQAEDKELKVQLLRRYSGYLGNLKQEFLKKKKKGKLPKEARNQLLEWWNRHYKWPYPSESQKVALAEETGLDQKQINNWFINQRKRHWKPTEDMQFVAMDAAYPHHYYLDNGVGMGSNAFPLDFNSSASHL
ncbi:unnamed protein product [Linum tenue]|uniref:Uncharacterized protein n=1 Tax=Linum tenue TaxID=586396 RepID=A0AAV0NPM7_9ROSI|nr:unnamed protein product [Linum tenue]